MTESDPLLTISEVSRIIRRSESTVLRLIRAGKLENRREGHYHYIRRSWVDRYIDNLPRGVQHRKPSQEKAK